jgi:opacity protein-like surface antigen
LRFFCFNIATIKIEKEKLMKKILLATAAIVTMSATGTMADVYYKNGDRSHEYKVSPYVGVYGGYGWSEDGSVDMNGGQYGLYIGTQADALLDATLNRTGLALSGALEAHYGWNNADDDGFSRDTEWGISFRPGLGIISNTLDLETKPYAIIGYKRAEIETPTGDNDHDGFELGIGTELVAWDHMSTRLEYSHTWFEEKGDFNPDDDSIRLGLGYRF